MGPGFFRSLIAIITFGPIIVMQKLFAIDFFEPGRRSLIKKNHSHLISCLCMQLWLYCLRRYQGHTRRGVNVCLFNRSFFPLLLSCVSRIQTSFTWFDGLILGSCQFLLLSHLLHKYYSLQMLLNVTWI